MKNFLAFLAFLLLLSCRPDTLHLTRNRSAAGAGSRPRHGSEESAIPSKPLPDTLVYVSAVEFPEDYDWQRDTAYGTVPCRVSLFLEGERILSVPAGPGTFVGADPDRMRIREGHLYTDCATETHTVICRDGEELFRYEGPESLRGFLLQDGKIHTLGQRIGREGFTYRIDGRVVMEREEGTLVGTEDHPAGDGGALYPEGGRICFSYVREGALPHEIHLVAGGKVIRSDTCPEAVWVHDQRLIGGVLYRVEKRTAPWKDPTLVIDGKDVIPPPWYRGNSRKCVIVPDREDVIVLGFSRPREADIACFWKCGLGFPVAEREDVITVLYEDGIFAWVAPETAAVGKRLIPFPGRMRLLSRKCAAFRGGRLFLALTGEPDLLLAGDGFSAIPVHGFLSGIRVEVPEKDVSLSP